MRRAPGAAEEVLLGLAALPEVLPNITPTCSSPERGQLSPVFLCSMRALMFESSRFAPSLDAMRLSIPILGLLPSSLAALITVSVPQTSVLANPSSLSSSTHAVLEEHGVKINAPLTRANTFVFENVTVGSYLLSVFCRDYFFENVRIDVTEAVAGDQQKSEKVEAWQTFRGNEWNNRGERRAGLAQGSVEVRPLGMKEYYQARSTCKHRTLLI